MTRAEALQAATTMLNETYPLKNSSGYATSTMTPVERLREIRRVARFLLGESEEDW